MDPVLGNNVIHMHYMTNISNICCMDLVNFYITHSII